MLLNKNLVGLCFISLKVEPVSHLAFLAHVITKKHQSYFPHLCLHRLNVETPGATEVHNIKTHSVYSSVTINA